GACVYCKSLKVRCEFIASAKSCKRCQNSGQPCIPRGRKKRKPALTQEELEQKSYEQDSRIKQLLQQLQRSQAENKYRDWVKNAPSYIEWLEGHISPRASFRVKFYFLSITIPGTPASSALCPPNIIRYCALYPAEILELFTLYVSSNRLALSLIFARYFKMINPAFSLLDPDHHTPSNLIWSSPFLFSVVCALASRHYTKRNIYTLAMSFAGDSAAQALISPLKNTETCQAYLLLSVYPIPRKRLAEDRSWIFMGVAFSLARELGLDDNPPASLDEREKLNRTRTWLNCFCVDGSYSTQSAKLPMISRNDYMAFQSRNWYISSPLNLTVDAHLCWYVHAITAMLEYQADMHRLREQGVAFDVVSRSITYDLQLCKICQEWNKRLETHPSTHSMCICWMSRSSRALMVIAAYMRLAMLSQAFQHDSACRTSSESYIPRESIYCARTVIRIVVQRLFTTGRLRYALESHFLFAAFAAAFLLNLMSPEHLIVFDDTIQDCNAALVRELIHVLGSDACAVDGRHSPALYSRFLSCLLGKYESRRR
ncbi:fungal-specific transcription factor domain-containing protein, partial [Hygrophoropsis aurantiaca]